MASSSALLSRELGFFSTVNQSRLQSGEGNSCCPRHIRSAVHSVFRQSLVSRHISRKSGPANRKASSAGFVDRSRMISTASSAGRKVLVQATDSTEVSTEEMTEAERAGWEKRMVSGPILNLFDHHHSAYKFNRQRGGSCDAISELEQQSL
jgi:hypothetical protein